MGGVILENRYKLTIDLKSKMITNNTLFKQGNAGTSVLEITLVDEGLPVNITGQTVQFNFLRSDSSVVSQDNTTGVTILDALTGKFECVLKAATLAVDGKVEAEIVFTEGTDILSSTTFVFYVDASIGLLSIKYITSITSQLEEWQNTFSTSQNDRTVTFNASEVSRSSIFNAAEELRDVSEDLREERFEIIQTAVDNVASTLSLGRDAIMTSTYVGIGNESFVPINLPSYNPDSDYFDVIYNGDFLTKDMEYSENENGLGVDLLGWTLDLDDIVVFRVHKAIVDSTSGAIAGSQIQAGGVTDVELSNVSGNIKERFETYKAESATQLATTARHLYRDLTALFQKHGQKMVMAGDSLSYNAYGFDGTFRQNAYDTFNGILSWAFMLRDAIHRNDPWFVSAEKMQYTAPLYKYFNANVSPNKWRYAFNQIYAGISVSTQASEVILYYKHNNPEDKAVLYMAKNNYNEACSVDIYVDGVLTEAVVDGVVGQTNANNYDDGTIWGGYSPQTIVVPLVGDGAYHEIKLTNFVGTYPTPHATDRKIFMYGIGSKLTTVELTGRGGTTSQYWVDNLATRITDYIPDVVSLIVGANDAGSSVPVATYKDNLNTIVDGIRAINPKCEIILLSSTNMENPANPNDVANGYIPLSIVQQYVDAMREVANVKSCLFIDLIKVFEGMPISAWRFDNVHLTLLGNQILANVAINSLIPNSVHDKKLVNPNATFISGKRYEKSNRHGTCKFHWNGTVFVIDDETISDVIAVTKDGANVITIEMRGKPSSYNASNTVINVIPVSLQQISDGGTTYITPLLKTVFTGGNKITYNLWRVYPVAGFTEATDWTTNPADFTFIFSW